MSAFAQDGLGVKLHSFHGMVAVTDSHENAILGPRSRVEISRQSSIDDQGMVASSAQRRGKGTVYALLIMSEE